MGRHHAEPLSVYGVSSKTGSYTKMHLVRTRKNSKRLSVS
jgi:hypothetical protein